MSDNEIKPENMSLEILKGQNAPADLPAVLSQRSAKCPNCHERLNLTGDPEENHHTAMRHRLVCPRRAEAEEENARLVSEFRQQANIIEQHRRIAEAERRHLEERPRKPLNEIYAEMAKGAERRPWWKFW